jgi:hypothetical protein
MSNFVYPRVCIASYNRPEGLKEKTLAFLQRECYPRERINIFVASESERDVYQHVCGDYNIVVGVLGLVQQRTFISDWLDESEIYVSLDDDVTGIKGKSFLELIRNACTAIETKRAGLWGVLPKDDARCFKDDTTEHLSFIVGAFFVARNHKDIRHQGVSETEDYERTMLYFLRYGSIFRYRGAGVQTKYLGTSGGSLGLADRKAAAVRFLLDKYPRLCSYRNKKGSPDLLLNWRYNPTQ